jgi:outer membrane biosynthesis protein TonB
MAVESNKDAKDANVSPAQTLTGVAAVTSNGTGANGNGKAAANRRKRPSSLLAAANQLPSVENSLDDFISRANQTLTDPDQWHAAENASKAEDEQRREADALRARAAEQQLREGEQREHSLRRQLDGLQGQLAEAEARAAVANTGGSQDGVIADLKMRLSRASERIVAAEQFANQADGRVAQMSSELASAKASVASGPIQSPQYDGDADERVRMAEAKAAKALAVARAASAGLTVNPADIAAIESGLIVPIEPARKGTNWLAIIGALVVGGAVMFGVAMAVKKDPAPAAVGAAQPAPIAPARPSVTPIEEPKPVVEAARPVETAPAPVVAPAPAPARAIVEQPAPVKTEPAVAKHVTTAVTPKHATTAPRTTAPKTTASAASNGGIADPFGDAPAKKAPAKKTDKKPTAGAIVDPF